MSRPSVILAPHWRLMDELFSSQAQAALSAQFDVVWGKDAPIPEAVYQAALPHARTLIAAEPVVDAATLAQAPNLKTVIEVSGAFPDSIDYAACFEAGVQVLSCSPGFRQSVAEMGLGMAITAARGLMSEHEAFRTGKEHWLNDNRETDFTLYGAQIGFIGFGQIAQELTRLLAPFRPEICAFDPWLPSEVAQEYGVSLVPLDAVLRRARCVFVTAVPTAENYQLLNRDRLALMQDNALLVGISRAHLIDFDALLGELETGRIRACLDVFPSEPVAQDDRIRQLPNVLLSPHRAAAVDKGRQLIGDMILADLQAIEAGQPHRRLAVANAKTVALMAGVGDAAQVADMASARS